MSFLPLDQMALRDGPILDSFGRLRVSNTVSLIGMSQEYSFHPLVWDHFTATGGTATYTIGNNSTVLSTAAATSGARAIRQTKVYHRYIPGKSHLIKMTGTLRKSNVPAGAAFAGIGYYDDDNGVFFRDSSAGVAVVERSNVSGSPVNTAVLQASWNVDKLDGTGSSGATVDWTKEQIFVIDFQWLGTGRVRYGLFVDGTIIICHQTQHANIVSSVYMRTANLPPRYEVFNSGGSGANISVEAICTSIESEGGVLEEDVYPFTFSAYVTTPMSLDTTLRPIAARRLLDTFNGITARGHSQLDSFQLRIGTNDVYWEIRVNPTVTMGGGGSTAVNSVDATYSISEYDTYAGAANTVSGGTLLRSGFAISGAGANRLVTSINGANSRILLGRTYANVRDTFVLCGKSLSATATLSLTVDINEQY